MLTGSGATDNLTTGTFTGFEDITLSGNNDTLTLTGDNLSVTVTGTGDTVNLGGGTDTVVGGSTVTLGGGTAKVSFTSGTNTVKATIGTGATLLTSDSLTGGSGVDTLAISGNSGSINLGSLVVFTGFEDVRLSGNSDTLTLGNNGLTVTITGTGDTVVLGTATDTVVGGHGNTVTLGGGTANVSFTSGTNAVQTVNANFTSADTITGGTGTDTIQLTDTGGVTVTDAQFANVTGVEVLKLAGTSGSNSVTLGSNVIADASSTGGVFTVDDSAASTALTLNASGLNSATAVDVVLSSWQSGDSLTGGPSANDTLVLTGSSVTDNLTTGIFTGFEDITLSGNSDTLTLNGASVAVKVTGTGDTVILGNGTDTVVGGSGNTVTLGSGTDTVSFTGGTNTVQAVNANFTSADTIAGGTGTDTIQLTDTGGVTVTDVQFANVTGVEVLKLAGTSGSNSVTLGANVIADANSTGHVFTVDDSAASTALTLNASALNSATAVDVVLSSWQSGDSLTGGPSANDTLVLTGSGATDNLTTGTFTGFEDITLNGSSNTLTLNGASVAVTGGSGNTVTLGGGTDTVSFTSGTNTVNAVIGGANPTLLSSDRLTGGSGTDTLAITGNSGTFNLTSLAAFTGFEDVTLSGDGDSLGLSAGTLSVTVTDSAPVTGNTVTLNTGKTTLTFSGGSNTLNATAATLLGTDNLTGAGADTLALSGGGTINLNTPNTLSGFTKVTEDNSNITLKLENGVTFSSVVLGSGTDTVTGGTGAGSNATVTLGTGTDTVSFSAGSNTVNAVSGGANPTLLVSDSLKGAGSDTLALTGGGTVDFNSLAGFSGFSTITEGGSDNYTLTMKAGQNGQTISLSSGTDTVAFTNANESNPSATNQDTIQNFTTNDTISFSGVGGASGITTVQGLITGTTNIAAHSIAWEQNGADTDVFANPTGAAHSQSTTSIFEIILSNFTASSLLATNFVLSNGSAGPAGIAGSPINLALTNPAAANGGPVSVTISGVPSGWSLNEGENLGNGTWSVDVEDLSTLTIMTATAYAGAMVLNVAETWTNADGSTGYTLVADNVEAYAPGSPIFALAGNDT